MYVLNGTWTGMAGLLWEFYRLAGLRNLVLAEDVAGNNPLLPGLRIAISGVHKTVVALPPPQACGIAAAWERLPREAQFLRQRMKTHRWYELLWHVDLTGTMTAGFRRCGVRGEWMGFLVDVSYQQAEVEVWEGDEESDEEEYEDDL